MSLSVASVRVQQLVIYPIKSCGALSVPELNLGEDGPWVSMGSQKIGDREWMIVNPAGEMFTQREIPKMSLLTLQMRDEKLFLKISEQEFEVPTGTGSLGKVSSADAGRMFVDVWGTKIEVGICAVPELNQALSSYLNKTSFLVHFDQSSNREATKKGISLGVQTRFTDTSPYLVISQESVDALNDKMENKVGPERFRANIIVQGGEAFGEDKWPQLTSKSVELESTKACGRCVVITIDPLAGKVANNEPLKALAKFRRDGSSVLFGQYFITKSFGQILRVGDQLQIG